MSDTITTIWQHKIEQALAWNPPENKKKFLESVKSLVDLNPRLYPTPAQRAILTNIYAHLEKLRNRSQIEEDILATCGMPV